MKERDTSEVIDVTARKHAEVAKPDRKQGDGHEHPAKQLNL